MSKSKIFIIISLFIGLLTNFVSANVFDRTEIQQFAKNYIEENIDMPKDAKVEISVANLDPRIQIKPCLSSLRANIPENHNSRNVNVKIYCEDKDDWQLYLPVRIKTVIPVLVAKTSISKGSLLDENNIGIEYKEESRVRGETITKQDIVIGAKAKRSLRPSTPITKRNICFVCKGENVTIIAKSNDFMIKTAGIALKDGSLGEQINVKNKKTGRTISAQVNAINKVLINL